MGVLHGFWTLILLVVFLGIVVWVWGSRRKKHFQDAAQIPFQEDRPACNGERDDTEKTDG